MAKSSLLQAALSKGAGKAVPAEIEPEPDVAPAAVSAAKFNRTDRAGQANVSAYLPKGFQASLRLLYAQTGRHQRELLAEALNDLFAKHDVPQVRLD